MATSSSTTSKTTGSTSYTNTLPSYIAPYVNHDLKAAYTESTRPYQPYGGARIAPETQATQSYYNMINGIASNPVSPGLTQAAGQEGQIYSGLGAFVNQPTASITSRYTPQTYNPNQLDMSKFNYNAGGFNQGAFNYNPGTITADQVTADQWNAQKAQQYMSPYIQQVVDVNKNQAFLDYQRANAARSDQAIAVGAFGDSRHGVVDALAQEALTRQEAQIQAQGMNDAWSQALQAFGGDRDAALRAMQGNQSANLQARLGTEQSRQFGAGLGAQGATAYEQSRQFGAGLGATGAEQAEASRQFGATYGAQSAQYANTAQMQAAYQQEQLRQSGQTIGLQALQQQLGATQALEGNAINQTNQQYAAANALGLIGAQQQAYNQQGYDLAYQDYLNQQNWNKNQLDWFNSYMRGTPTATNTTSTNATTVSPYSQFLGAGIAALGQAWPSGSSSQMNSTGAVG